MPQLGDDVQYDEDRFADYYAKESTTPETLARFAAIRDTVLRMLGAEGRAAVELDVADIGCGAGTQSVMWAKMGHRVHGIDINENLITLAGRRAAEQNVDIEFRTGTATALPLEDSSVDVCLLPELLEHVEDWRTCLGEAARILRPGGVLFVSTTNVLCPKQQEFDLPLYSWYPGPIKKRYERLAVTTRRELVNFAEYPAVHWFTYFGLRKYLSRLGFPRSYDRFDVMDVASKALGVRGLVALIRALPPLRWLAHVGTPYTFMLSIKGETSQ